MPGSTVTCPAFHIQRQDAVESFGAIDDQSGIDGLAALAGAAAARRHRHAFLPRDGKRRDRPSMLRGTTTPAGII